jgi:TetR/AcrR family transcriptional repressor of nem operon
VHVDLSSTDVGPQVVRAYLSRQHFEDVENSCPMVAVPTPHYCTDHSCVVH